MSNQTVETDILIVGGGPAGLAAAIHFADLVAEHNKAIDKGASANMPFPLRIMVLEKGNSAGQHSLSGAVVNPQPFRELLPGIADKDLPFETPVTKEDVQFLTKDKTFSLPFHPPYMENKGNYVASLGKVVRWLTEQAEKKGIQIYTGFAAQEFLYENDQVVGVRTGASGIDKHGHPMDNYQAPTDVRAKITILAEGTRGHLTKVLVDKYKLGREGNPQVYSLGVKEIWEVPEGNFEMGRVIHSLGFPLSFSEFGGGFIYGLSKTQISIGLVVGLDYTDPTFDPHHAFQLYKMHPDIQKILKNGKMVRYGAKTIPEGGYFAIPQMYHHNVLLVGDSAGLVAMPSLKGVHLAVRSGMLAAQAAFEALQKKNTSLTQLSHYEQLVKASDIFKELYPVRNFRQSFRRGLIWGLVQFGTQIITGGRGFSLSGRLKLEEDGKHYRAFKEVQGHSFLDRNKEAWAFDKVLTFDKETDIYFSGTKHDEEQPTHIIVPSADLCSKCIENFEAPCQRFCPAQVFEIAADPKTGKRALTLHPSNCVHCKTCDIKDPYANVTWVTPYGGDGPEYESM